MAKCVKVWRQKMLLDRHPESDKLSVSVSLCSMLINALSHRLWIFFQLAAQQFLFWEYECAANATGVMCSIIVIIEAMRRLIIDLMAATFPCCDWRNGSCNRLIVRDSNRDLVVTNQPIEVVWVAEFEPSLSVISNDVLVSVKCSWSSRQLV
jgi:hypothetical protein